MFSNKRGNTSRTTFTGCCRCPGHHGFQLALWVLVVWLSSRGRFKFLHCVALNRAEVQVPGDLGLTANSLFWFRIVATFFC